MSAEIINIEGLYFSKARELRGRALTLKVTGNPKEALHLRCEARRLDTTAYCIQAKADAMARAALRFNCLPEQVTA